MAQITVKDLYSLDETQAKDLLLSVTYPWDGYRYHEGGHTDAPDWPAFFEFARKYINF